MKIADFVKIGKAKLSQAGLQCKDPSLHIKQIIQAGLEMEMTDLYLNWHRELTESEMARLERFLERRCAGEPFQHIVGYEWFWESKFLVGPGVFIPRQETELIVEFLLKQETRERLTVGELGAGSGNIGISVLQQRPQWQWTAYESNPETLPYLEKNCASLLPQGHHYRIQEGDFFELAPTDGPFDWLVSNPPYVVEDTIAHLSKEVQRDPILALSGGKSGLETIERFAKLDPRFLKPEGGLVFEIGADQKEAVISLFQEELWQDLRVLDDLAGLPRIVIAKRRTP